MRIGSNIMRCIIAVSVALASTSCGSDRIEVEGQKSLEKHVQGNSVGRSTDYWIEMQILSGEWERTGLIFGYVDDYGECQTAIAGLKKVNFEREYRCVPAQLK